VFAPLQTGITLHSALEAILRNKATTREEVSNLVDEPISDYVKKLTDVEFENPADEVGKQVAIVQALAHAYTRITIPWVHDNFDIVDVEPEQGVKLAGDIIWRARTDFVTRAKAGLKRLAIHDFKSQAYWSDNNPHDEWRDSLQQMMNAWVCSMVYGERVDHFYIHILVKGTKTSPSYLTHPSYRPANPPIVQEDILPYYTRKAGYARVFAPEIPLTIPEWVWRADASYVAKSVPVLGPYEVDYNKVERFLKGLPTNEGYWRMRLEGLDWSQWKDPDFQSQLDTKFPRTFNCYEFGKRRCQFYDICHRAPGWDDPIGSGKYQERIPHHSIGETDEE